MKIFQILHGRCHWQTPFTSLAETVGRFPADCLFVEAPDYVNEQWGFDETEVGDDRFIKPVPPEGFIYDDETGQMYPESMLGQILEETKESKQAENNAALASYLDSHPLTWVDGKQYGVTKEDQNEIAMNLLSYQMAVASNEAMLSVDPEAEVTVPVLEWHPVHEACVPWTQEELVALSIAIRQFIYDWYTLNQTYKTAIYACETAKEVQNINIVYNDEAITAMKNGTLFTEDTTEENGETTENTETIEPGTEVTEPTEGTDTATEPESAETESEDPSSTETGESGEANQ